MRTPNGSTERGWLSNRLTSDIVILSAYRITKPGKVKSVITPQQRNDLKDVLETIGYGMARTFDEALDGTSTRQSSCMTLFMCEIQELWT